MAWKVKDADFSYEEKKIKKNKYRGGYGKCLLILN